jgi:DNA gyrase subunit A
MRLVIELTRTVEPSEVLQQLFKMTALQGTFSINMLALVDGEPRLLPLKRALQLFIEHRQEVITRRSQHELEQAQQRAHILEGLQVALANLDVVIQVIRRSRTTETAQKNLQQNLKLSEAQARAILDMPLRRLVSLERKKIETEYKELLKDIKYLETLLKTPKKILQVIKEELADLKEEYNTPRRTVIVDEELQQDKLITAGDLVPEEAVVVCVSQNGQICRWPVVAGLDPARGRQKDPLVVAVPANTRETLYLFKANGEIVIIPMHHIPSGEAPGEGVHITEFCSKNGPVVAGLTLPGGVGYIFLVSRSGRVKRVTLSDITAIRGRETVVMGLERGDQLLTAFLTPGEEEVVLVSNTGQTIRFSEVEVRPMGLSAAGVLGIKLDKKDSLVGAGLVKPRGDLVIVTERGHGKRTDLAQYPKQGRYGQGVIGLSLTKESGLAAAAAIVNVSDRVMFLSKRKNKTIYARSITKMGRNQKGKELIAIRGKDELTYLVTLVT